MIRHDGRAADDMREVELTPDFLDNPLGSVLMRAGNTRVVCTASVDERVPPFLKGAEQGSIFVGNRGPGSTGQKAGHAVAFAAGRLSLPGLFFFIDICKKFAVRNRPWSPWDRLPNER